MESVDFSSQRLRAVFALLTALCASVAAACDCGLCVVDSRDEFWMISTRDINEIPCQVLSSQLKVYQWRCGGWRQESLVEFAATHDPVTLTLFYVHGNRYTPEDAVESGWLAYQRLRQGGGPRSPLRFVIWSWPSERVPGLVNDVRVKAERTDTEGLYLGTVVSRLPPDTRTSFLGYSFGTRVISGSLHLLAGGSLEGRTLPPEHLTPRRPMRAAMMAPAFHNNWLMPGAFHARALTQLERLIVLYNPRDPVLRRYRIVSPTSAPQALGYTGLMGLERLGPLARRVEQWNVSDEVGRRHDEQRHLNSSYFIRMREFLVWRTPPTWPEALAVAN